MTIEEIIKKYLVDNGFDGLCNPDLECGCSIEDSLPCGAEGIMECQPAYKHHCNPIKEDNSEYDADLCPLGCCGECYRIDKKVII